LASEGRAQLHAGQAAVAAGKFRQALAFDPYHPAALEGLVAACEALGQTETAQRYRNRVAILRRRTAT
jgi:Flp pilus assembly protein TadD